MALTYSLRFKKLNFYNKVTLEKEGEIVIDRQSFRLKGKGAQDQGETIYFGDIKDLHVKEDFLTFSTYSKEKYVLGEFSNLFDMFLKDFMRVRNEYMADSLFMKVGMLIHEYEGSVEVENTYGKLVQKGRSRIQFYEGSIVIMPEARDAFPIYLRLLKNHEFDDDEFTLRLFLENGQNVYISQLGTSFEDVRETMESIMGKMYEKVVNGLTQFLPSFDASTLVKLVYLLRGGRFVTLKALKKIHEELPEKIEAFVFQENPAMREKAHFLRKQGGDENFFLSLSVGKSRESGELFLRTWFLQAIPEKNLVAIGRTSGSNDATVHFFRVIMQQGVPQEKLTSKILEIDQTMIIFRYDFSVVYKDRRDLRKSKYRTALKKISFLRLLRKSYLGHSTTPDLPPFEADFEKFLQKAQLQPRPAVAAAA